jgi:predicted DNA binding CopG/RHH family protein
MQYRYEELNKDKSASLRLSSDLLDAIKALAKTLKLDYQRLIREAIEGDL